MFWVALKMLTGNRAKYYAIIFGIAFASMLMTQQSSIFFGLMRNTSSQIRDIQGADFLAHAGREPVLAHDLAHWRIAFDATQQFIAFGIHMSLARGCGRRRPAQPECFI